MCNAFDIFNNDENEDEKVIEVRSYDLYYNVALDL